MPDYKSPLIAADQLLDIHSMVNVGIVDCRFGLDDTERGRQSWKGSCIPDARYAHLDEDLSAAIGDGSRGRHPLPKPSRIALLRSTWGFDEDTFIVCYDDAGGPFAARLWWMLRWIGHEQVAVLDGGWQAWLAANGPMAPGNETITVRPPGLKGSSVNSPVSIQTRLLASVDDLKRGTGKAVDARARERYLGETEPIDAVAGHIPGAVSMPWMENLDLKGHFLPSKQLSERWRQIGGSEHAISYCGSGVTACHNILAAAAAGLPLPKLYPPSWSGWIHDPDRPVAVGDNGAESEGQG